MNKKSPAKEKKAKTKAKEIRLPRAPIVAVLGHVDHGKTTLLDKIRHTHVQAGETGGITQHIGAYQVSYKDQPITFIDTPGHAAFSKMRARGANVTDLVVLVVAATEGVKPQTKESIRHIKAAGVPLVVAINKMDLPGANPDVVKAGLAEVGVMVESYGGDTVTVEISAKEGKNIDQLLEMILLVSSLQNIQGDAQGPLKAVIIESSQDRRRGALATVIVKNGTLKVGDAIVAAAARAKVRALFDENGARLDQAKPGNPAEVLGFKIPPPVGEVITRVGEASPVAPSPVPKEPIPLATPKEATPEEEKEVEAEEKEEAEERPRIKAILKADTQGTLEAIKTNVASEVEQVGEGVGEVNESDVLLAHATGAKILCFRVSVRPSAQKLAETEKVEIKTYQAIYELLEDLEKQVLKLLEPTIDEEIVGEADIVAEFLIKHSRIAGCKVKSGKIDTAGTIHLMRQGKIVGDATIKSLKQGKNDIPTAKRGEACGVVLKPSLDFKVGDTLQYYRTIN
ncbi:MAG: translation initiation factor IF-2 [Candidatus Chisholmbacteria bacterium]|nr:translation initiation factor IF-2 [Candidatus Chisholmbacteria bacterium]